MLFYPCILDPKSGHIIQKVTTVSMTQVQAEDFLKKYYTKQWLTCEAVPQAETRSNLLEVNNVKN